MIQQKFSYPLGAMCFTEKECNSIQAKFLPTVLSKMGINRLTPREVCSDPSLYAGMVVSELWPIQGSSKNKLLIGHLRKTDIVGDNLQVGLDCLQLQAGISWDVLSREDTLIQPYVDKCGHHTCGNSTIVMDSLYTKRTSHGSYHNERMICSSWRLSLIFLLPLPNACVEHNAVASIYKPTVLPALAETSNIMIPQSSAT
jgi:hypothetical protein